MSGIFWGRANAWAAYTMSQVGLRLPECYLYPKFLDVVGSLNDQLAALKLLQTENGLWRTIVDDPESYEEISASAGTAVMKDREGYRGISRDWIQGWGQGLALAFLSGVLNYDKMRSDGAL